MHYEHISSGTCRAAPAVPTVRPAACCPPVLRSRRILNVAPFVDTWASVPSTEQYKLFRIFFGRVLGRPKLNTLQWNLRFLA